MTMLVMHIPPKPTVARRADRYGSYGALDAGIVAPDPSKGSPERWLPHFSSSIVSCLLPVPVHRHEDDSTYLANISADAICFEDWP